ncbi:MAG: hypothetical protein EOM87_06695 [Clostridia bacterium]|nr:hypothetical protein [Clostridia bacterium]
MEMEANSNKEILLNMLHMVKTLYFFDVMPARNLKLYARWTPILITVTLELNGGRGAQKITALEGSIPEAPEEPTKVGYVFFGWFSDEQLTLPYNFMTAFNTDITVYAKWEADSKSIAVYTFGALRSLIESDPYGTYYLGNNLDVGGENISSLGTFYGTLDGNGYEICNYSISSYNCGLFTENNGVIRNLVISNFTLSTPKNSQYGASVGGIAVINNGIIRNVCIKDFSINIKIAAKDYINSEVEIGGISAVNDGKILNCLLERGTISLDITRENINRDEICDIVGGAIGTNNDTLSDISANLSIDIKYGNTSKYSSEKYIYAGGIVGQNKTSILSKNLISEGNMSVCISDEISIYETQNHRTAYFSTFAYIGSVIGFGSSGSFNNVIGNMETIVDIESLTGGGGCALADLTNNIYLGGIVGKLQDANLTFCSSMNNIKLTTNDRIYDNYGWSKETSNICCGGIAGDATSATFTSCSSTGLVRHDVKAQSGSIFINGKIELKPGDTYSKCGGIAGQMTDSSAINCYSTGNITATSIESYFILFYVGGISGYTAGSSVIDCCYAEGNIRSEGNTKGGISGYLSSESLIKMCFAAAANNITSDGRITDSITKSFSLDTHTPSQFKSLEWLFYELCWDGEIWIADGVSYPKLRFQIE